MPCIYKITNDIDQKIYIGKTTYSIELRWEWHLKDYKRERCKKRPLYNAMLKYGVEHFYIEQIEECSADILSERETFWIEYYGSFKNGYNATKGGDGKPYADYDLIFRTFQICKTYRETARLTGYDLNTVKVAVKLNGGQSTVIGGELSRKPIAMLNKDTGEILKTFSCAKEAEKYLNISYTSHISDVCLGKRKTYQGYGWKYI